MGVTVTNLSSLDPALVAQFDTSLTALVQEYNPDLVLTSGTFHDLLIHLHALLDAATQENIDLVMQANSLLAISQNPTLADTTIVDLCLSNYGLVRNPGAKASGKVTIVLSQLLAVVIPQGSIYTMNGLQFAPTTTFAARTDPSSVLTDNDVLITPLDVVNLVPTTYSFSIPMTALIIGTDGNVARATQAVPSVPPPVFLKAYATDDFIGGMNEETNQELINQQEAGLAIKAWSNRVSIEALIRKQAEFANIQTLSIIGFGDPEMLRDQHTIWPGSTGGRSDVYLKTLPIYQNLTLTLNCTLISKAGPVGTWQYGFDLNTAPGMYEVQKFILTDFDPTSVGFLPISDVRGFDITSPPSDTLQPPDIVNAVEGAFSRYQTDIVQFVDTVTDVTGMALGATAPYLTVVKIMPLIADIQDFLNQRSIRPPMCDVEVKAAVPCFTTVAFTVNYNNRTAAPSTAAIQNAVAAAVNNLGFTGSLSRTLIDQTLAGLLTNLVSVTGYALAGTILQPDDTEVVISDPQTLTIPDDPANMVTGRTVAFFLQPSDVSVTLIGVDTPNV